MEVLIILVFISLVLVVLGLGFFAWCVKSRTFEHSERLALLPLSDSGDDPPRPKEDLSGRPRAHG